jgi:hypothetical protein
MPGGATSRRRLLLLIWVLFIVRGTFYCVQQPMWEGFDEWAHFAYVQCMGENGSIPRRTDPVSHVVLSSLQLVPLSKSAAKSVPGSITHEAYWRLSQIDRDKRHTEVRMLAASFDHQIEAVATGVRQYESQQPPLYYAVLSLAYKALRSLSLPTVVFALRLLNVVIASAVVFVSYALARLLVPGAGFALLLPVLITCLPGLLISVCRVGNESLSVVLSGSVLLLMVKATRSGWKMRVWATLGVVLGAALLTKAFALSFLPLLFVTALLSIARTRTHWRKIIAGMVLSLSLACLIAGWWYWRTWSATGTFSGEQLDVAASAGRTFSGKLGGVTQVNWRSVVDSAAFTHIWIGGWSFLTARKWMYRTCESIAAIAFAGVVIFLVRYGRFLWATRRPGASGAGILLTLTFYLSMCGALAYHALVVHLAQGVSTALGWYLYGVLVAEVLLIKVGFVMAFGLRYGHLAVVCICVLACALDLYTTQFLLMPFYSGLSSHYPEAGRQGGYINLVFTRLAVNESPAITPAVVAGAWAAYLCATVVLAAIAVWTFSGAARRGARVPAPHPQHA